jgi:predicted nucleotidyltransferase
MKFPEGIEGDYLETKKDALIFDIKGLRHPKDRKISFIRFFPHKNGDRVRDDIKYKKIYDLEDRYDFLKDKYPQFLFFSKRYDIELQGVSLDEIKKIYTPRDHLKKLKSGKNLKNISDDLSVKLCDIFINEGNLKQENIGITGSSMVNLSKNDSDIDIVIYGTEVSKEFQETIKNIFNSKSNEVRKYNIDELKEHYYFRAGGSGISFEDFVKSEKHKLHQGKFNNIDFFIRYIKNPNDWKGTYYDYQYKNLGRIKLLARILDAQDSIFTPCSYKIKVSKILNSNSNDFEIGKGKISEINSYRGRFCEQAKKNDKIFVEGKLERVKFKDSEIYYRILLGNQKKDKMIKANH